MLRKIAGVACEPAGHVVRHDVDFSAHVFRLAQRQSADPEIRVETADDETADDETADDETADDEAAEDPLKQLLIGLGWT